METLLEKYLTPDNITFMLQAAGVSVVIAALALTFGLCLGILGAAGRISKNKVAHGIATFYVETIRGTPADSVLLSGRAVHCALHHRQSL